MVGLRCIECECNHGFPQSDPTENIAAYLGIYIRGDFNLDAGDHSIGDSMLASAS